MLGPTKDDSTLTSDEVRTEALDVLRAHLPIEAQGYKVSSEMVFDILLHAAATGTSVEAACDDLLGAADANTIREYINAQLTSDKRQALLDQLNEGFAAQLPRKVRRGRLDLACDAHDEPYYGSTPALLDLTCGAPSKAGAKHFFRIATAYIMHDGIRFTVAVEFVLPHHDVQTVLLRLLGRVAALGLHIRRLWLDRGYASIPVFHLLQQRGVPAIIACPIRGRSGGTRALCRGRGSYSTNHTFRSCRNGSHHARVEVVRTFIGGNGKPRKARWMIFVQIHSELSPLQVRLGYKHRFGIESSFRCMRQVRIKTTSRNPILRFVYMAIALLLVNVWTALRFAFCQIPRRGRGGRPIDYSRLRLHRVASLIRHAIERRYGVTHSIQAHALPLGL